MKKILFLVFPVLLLASCKSEAKKRKACEKVIPQLIDKWLSEKVGEDSRQKMQNMIAIYNENKDNLDYKIIKMDLNEPPSEELRQFVKSNVGFLDTLENPHRYDEASKKVLSGVLIACFPQQWGDYQPLLIPGNNEEWTAQDLLYSKPSSFVDEQWLTQSLSQQIPDDADVEHFKNIALDKISMDYKNYMPVINHYEYVAATQVQEFVRPELKATKNNCLAGYVSANVKLYRIADKSIVFEKKVVAENMEGIESMLRDKLIWEIKLQLFNAGYGK